MGNCIAGPDYLRQALRGQSVLAALVGPDNRIVANAELRPHRAGWVVGEFQARFNNEAALAGLDRQLRDRTPQLTLLLGDEPLPALPRRLARTVPIASARSVEVVARRLRRSLGRLAGSDDPQLAAHVPREVDTGLLCSLVLTVSTATTPTTPALLVPASWLGRGGWPALWARAHRRDPRLRYGRRASP